MTLLQSFSVELRCSGADEDAEEESGKSGLALVTLARTGPAHDGTLD